MSSATNTKKSSTQLSPLKRLRDAQEKLLRESQNADFTVQCGKKTWKCSAMILSQRCDFFRIAASGSFKESETRVVKLNDETIEEVDMLLLHLYTLEDPNFENKEFFKYRYRAAESALKLEDKYNLPVLGTAGQRYMSQSWKDFHDWRSMSEDNKEKWIRRLERLWSRNYSGTDIIWKVAIERLIAVAKDVIEYEPFQQLCEEYLDFALEFMRAQAKAADAQRGGLSSKPIPSKKVSLTPLGTIRYGDRW